MTLSTPKTFNYKKLLFLSLAFNLLLTVILLSRTCSRRPETEKVYSQDLYKGGSNTFTNTVSNKHTAAAAGNKLTAYLRRHGSAPALIKKLATDNQLQLYKYNSAHFQNSRLFAMLEGAPKMDVYLILEYNASLNYKELSLLNKRNLDSKLQAKTEYLHKRWGIYYCRYEALADIKDLTFLKNIYIINRFTARGYYNIAFRPEQASENFHVSLMLPYSKPGKELVSMQPHIRGIFKLIAKEYNGNKLKLELRTKGYPIVLFCELAYHVDLYKTISMTVYAEENFSIQRYKKLMQQPRYRKLYRIFTSESEKIFFTPFVKKLSRKIAYDKTLGGRYIKLWRLIQEYIPYDQRKKEYFFSGNISYTDIRDMYRNMQQLEADGIGACTERRPLETAVLRYSGIAARVATRASHIFTEIFIPDKGWVSTAPLLNEVPLCAADNEKIKYFMNWSPELPVKILRWKSLLYPVVNKF